MARARKSQAEKMKAVKGLIANINKKAGENVINFASDEEMAEQLRIEFIPTVSFALNSAFGGFPKGKFSLVTGDPDAGKTSLILETIGHNMRLDQDFTVCWIESENSLSDDLIEMFHIDPSRFIVHEVDPENGSAEASMDYAIAMAQAGVDMVVINSLKAMVPQKEVKDNMEDANIAISARLNAKFMRKVLSIISKSGTALVCTQQKSINIGCMFGDPSQITGGRAILYSSVLTLNVSQVSIKAGDPYYDMKEDYRRIRVKVMKNHVCGAKANPYTVTDYTVKLGVGTDTTGEILQEAYNMDIITKQNGGYFREYTDCEPHDKKNIRILPDGTKAEWRGAPVFQAYLEEHPEYFAYIKERVENGVSTLVESMSQEEIDILSGAEVDDTDLDIDDLEEVLGDAE